MDFQLMSKPVSQQIMELREKIRVTNYTIQQEQVIRRKTTIVLTSTARYDHKAMLKSLDEFKESRKKLKELDTKLARMFDRLYQLNTQYNEVEVLVH